MSDQILNSKDVARSVAQKLELPSDTTEEVVREVLDTIVAHLGTGGEVRLSGFGTFKTVKRAAREGRNPRTGEKIQVPEQMVVRFVAGKNLKSLGGETS
jgi:DNA-binding protein HU-beta